MKILLYQRRKERGLSLEKLSRRCGIGSTTLNNIENEKTSPNLRELELIAKAMGIKITQLFDSEYK